MENRMTAGEEGRWWDGGIKEKGRIDMDNSVVIAGGLNGNGKKYKKG